MVDTINDEPHDDADGEAREPPAHDVRIELVGSRHHAVPQLFMPIRFANQYIAAQVRPAGFDIYNPAAQAADDG